MVTQQQYAWACVPNILSIVSGWDVGLPFNLLLFLTVDMHNQYHLELTGNCCLQYFGCYFKTGIISSSDVVQQTLLLVKV